jgi:AbrB family looped-hinge helix DNA binding protein
MDHSFNSEDSLIGSTVMGERGQIVIPKEFREKKELESGSRLVVIQHGDGPICLVKADAMQGFVKSMNDRIQAVLKKM